MNIPPLKKTYAGRTVLHTPEFELEPGMITAVIGANGSGKSTLAKLLAGVEKPDEKAVFPESVRVGYMPQKSYAFRMSTFSNIMLGGSSREKCTALMKDLRIDHLASKPAYRLSGGETARMALARLLMGDYDLLILDEPTAALDIESTLLSESLLKKYCAASCCASLVITHSIRQAERIAGSILFLDGGELIEQGDACKLLAAPREEKTKRFLDFYGI